MLRPRVIPVLLLADNGLVKSIKFKDYNYIGDPINAVRIFNDLRADELVFLDVKASGEKRLISTELIREIGEEANMPFAVGGGITSLEDIQKIISAGAEKVIIGTEAVKNPDFIRQAASAFGSSTICVCMDVKKKFLKGMRVHYLSGEKTSEYTPEVFAKLMEANGAGEIIVQSIENDGQMTGYDTALIRSISESVSIPVIALGGAGTSKDLKTAYKEAYASGVASGSFFVYQGNKRGVLINYPDRQELKKMFLD